MMTMDAVQYNTGIDDDLFRVASWLYVMVGQRLVPLLLVSGDDNDPLDARTPEADDRLLHDRMRAQLDEALRDLRAGIAEPGPPAGGQDDRGAYRRVHAAPPAGASGTVMKCWKILLLLLNT